MDRTRIEIHGLPDDDAAAQLESQLKGRTGVPEATVDATLQLAEVSYDPKLVSPADIINWIRGHGYDARLAGRARGARGT